MKNSGTLENPIPTFDWYQQQSMALKLSPRCPFASAKLCPRYFRTLLLFGKYSVVERMSKAEETKLEEQLEKSPMFSREFQPQPELTVTNNGISVTGFRDCCPELAFDAYRVFASAGSFMDKEDERLRHAQLKNEKVHSDDWRWKYSHLEPAHFSECRENSILAHAFACSATSKQQGARPGARNISQKERWEIFVRDNFTCKYCGRKPPEVALTVDHVTPVDADGTKEPGNLVAACQDCNSGKSNRPPPKL